MKKLTEHFKTLLTHITPAFVYTLVSKRAIPSDEVNAKNKPFFEYFFAKPGFFLFPLNTKILYTENEIQAWFKFQKVKMFSVIILVISPIALVLGAKEN